MRRSSPLLPLSLICLLIALLTEVPSAQSNHPIAHTNQVDALPAAAQQMPEGLAAQLAAAKQPIIFGKAVGFDSGGPQAQSMAVADLNGDGKLDVVVGHCCASSATVSVLLGNGDGTLQTPVSYYVGGDGVNSVAIGDVNGDSVPDLVVATEYEGNGYTNGGVAVLLGNGDGTFQPPVSYDSGGVTALSVAIADVNGDGHPDLVVGNDNAVVDVFLGNGDGTFKAPVGYPALNSPTGLVVTDLNGDGTPDIVTAGDESYVGVLLGNGDGTFLPVVTYNSGRFVQAFAVADVNGDGKLDVVIALACPTGGCTSGAVSVLLGNGDGTLQTTPIVTYFPVANDFPTVVIQDLDGDGKPDAVIATYYGGGALVLLGNGDGTFQPPTTYGSGFIDNPEVAIADMNGDGKPDLLTVSTCSRCEAPTLNLEVRLNTLDAVPVTAATSSRNPSLVNQPVTFTATITSNPPIPDGEIVTFSYGANDLGTSTTKNGAASLTTSFSKARSYFIKASYPGDLFHKKSVGSVKQVVSLYSTTTAVSSSLNPSNYGQSVTLMATVTSTGPSVPTGTVTFKNGTASLGSVALNGSVAMLTKTNLPVGTLSIGAEYSGDSQNGKSTSPVLRQTVNQARILLTLFSSPNPSTTGKSVKFTATLSSNGGLPSGSANPVAFTLGSTTLGIANPSSLGVATFLTTTLPMGSDEVTATYAGGADYRSASNSVTQTVN
jgi:Bacterial Ig-like domain (group 3)/FG-GAP-like repeat/FG-GAP repeat